MIHVSIERGVVTRVTGHDDDVTVHDFDVWSGSGEPPDEYAGVPCYDDVIEAKHPTLKERIIEAFPGFVDDGLINGHQLVLFMRKELKDFIDEKRGKI